MIVDGASFKGEGGTENILEVGKESKEMESELERLSRLGARSAYDVWCIGIICIPKKDGRLGCTLFSIYNIIVRCAWTQL